jgi:hypothetical protein
MKRKFLLFKCFCGFSNWIFHCGRTWHLANYLDFLSDFLDEQILNGRSRPRQFEFPQQNKKSLISQTRTDITNLMM